MGWSSGNREQVTAEQMGWKTSSGKTIEAIKHSRVGTEDWFLYVVRDAAGEVIDRLIQVTIWDGSFHKEICEQAGPYYFGCPVAWLDEVPQPECYYSEGFNWRESVRKRAA